MRNNARERKEPNMAAKNIVVAESGLKFVLNPNKRDAGKRVNLDAKQSKAVRNIVDAYVAADERDLPYAERLKAGKRVGMKGNNRLVKQIRAYLNDNQHQVSIPAPVQKQQQNVVPTGVPLTKAGTPDRRYKAKAAVPAAKEEGQQFDYAAMEAYANAIEKLTNAGFTKDEAKKMAAALR